VHLPEAGWVNQIAIKVDIRVIKLENCLGATGSPEL
jgi:hypothetical protein